LRYGGTKKCLLPARKKKKEGKKIGVKSQGILGVRKFFSHHREKIQDRGSLKNKEAPGGCEG